MSISRNDRGSAPVTGPVFLSWAHKDRSWSEEETGRWKDRVIGLGHLLDKYVDVEADFYHYTERGVDWTRYGPRVIDEAAAVLIVSSDAYWERWSGRNPPEEGAGVAREADALHGMFNRNQKAFQQRVLILIMPGNTDEPIPSELDRIQRYKITSMTQRGVENVLRWLLDKPRYIKRKDKIDVHLPTYILPDQHTVDSPYGMPGSRADHLARQRERRRPNDSETDE
jgi:hypothetical protein